MSVLITGHTKGIGKAIAEMLTKKGYSVTGISRSTGNDISNIKITEFLEGVDVFINNAYETKHQTRLLVDAIDYWQKDSNKLIININSKMTMLPINQDHLDDWTKSYIQDKKEQTDIINKQLVTGGVKVCNIIVGLTDTDMAKNVFNAPKMLKPEDIAEVVFSIIGLTQNINIQNIVVDAAGLNWQDIKRLN